MPRQAATRLSELVISGLSLGSPRRAAIVPNAPFSINRREGEAERGFQGLEVERIEKREKEEEERRGNEVEALSNRDYDRPYVVSCSVFFAPVD